MNSALSLLHMEDRRSERKGYYSFFSSAITLICLFPYILRMAVGREENDVDM